MTAELEDLMREYTSIREKEGITHLDLVILEHKIWDQLKLEHGTGLTKRPEVGERRDWFVKHFGGQTSTYDNRFTIYKAGSWAHSLLDLVDKGTISLGVAKNLVGEAKRVAKRRQVSPAEALQFVLENEGSETHEEDDDEPSPPLSAPIGTMRSFHRTVTVLAEGHLEEALSSVVVNEYYKRTLIDDFRDSLDLLIREFGRRINQVKHDTKLSSKRAVGAVRFNWACEVLGLKYEWGEDNIDMVAVKARKNKRTLELHPDRNKSNPQAGRELERVLEAYEILEQYTSRRGNNG